MTITESTDTDRGVRTAEPGDGEMEYDDFVRATGGRMHRTALLLTGGDHYLAEDLTQTTYAKVFASWRRVTRADDPVAYTHTILTRTFLSHRRLRRNSEQPIDVLPERVGVPADPTLRLDLLDALAHLRPDDRTVLVLRYWQDLTVAQTGDLMRMSEATVRQRSHRALARLRALVPDLDPTSTSTSSYPQEHR